MIGSILGWKRAIEGRIALTTVLVVAMGSVAPSGAWDGELDHSWDGDGIRYLGATDTISRGYGVALQCDGKVVVTGVAEAVAEDAKIMVARFNADGSPDASFATAGRFTITLGDYGASGWDVAVQPDGKIVVVGTAIFNLGGAHAVVLRLTPAGVLDSSFSSDGLQFLYFNGATSGNAVALQNDGRILIAGKTTSNSSMVVARLTTNGSLDSTFDSDGSLLLDFTGGDDEARDVKVQPDGRILVVGTAAVPGGSVAVVIRTLNDGTLDTSFGPGAGGATAIDFGTYSQGRGLVLQSDGKIVAAGSTDFSTSIAVARLTENGILDTSFSGDGMAYLDLVLGPDEGWDIAVHGKGRVLVVGTAYASGRQHVAMARFRPDGGLDSAFGGNGYVLLDFGADSLAYAVSIQPNDWKAVIVGNVQMSPSEAWAVVGRVVGDENLVFADAFECGDDSAWSP